MQTLSKFYNGESFRIVDFYAKLHVFLILFRLIYVDLNFRLCTILLAFLEKKSFRVLQPCSILCDLFYFILFLFCLCLENKEMTTLCNVDCGAGPGCSSVGGGMLSELGPFYPTIDGVHLLKNPHSWNKGTDSLSSCPCF